MRKITITVDEVTVALRKESVDRNMIHLRLCNAKLRSLSARRAWIEMHMCHTVDRVRACRSPQGERG